MTKFNLVKCSDSSVLIKNMLADLKEYTVKNVKNNNLIILVGKSKEELNNQLLKDGVDYDLLTKKVKVGFVDNDLTEVNAQINDSGLDNISLYLGDLLNLKFSADDGFQSYIDNQNKQVSALHAIMLNPKIKELIVLSSMKYQLRYSKYLAYDIPIWLYNNYSNKVAGRSFFNAGTTPLWDVHEVDLNKKYGITQPELTEEEEKKLIELSEKLIAFDEKRKAAV